MYDLLLMALIFFSIYFFSVTFFHSPRFIRRAIHWDNGAKMSKRKIHEIDENGDAGKVETVSLSKAKKTSATARSYASLTKTGIKGMYPFVLIFFLSFYFVFVRFTLFARRTVGIPTETILIKCFLCPFFCGTFVPSRDEIEFGAAFDTIRQSIELRSK